MSAELARPGVEVIQVVRTVSPTVVTPTLAPCVVAVCKQVVDVVVPSSSGGSQLNSSALISLPANLVAADAAGDPPVYGGLDGLDLVLSINYGPDVTITLEGNSLTPTSVVAQIQAAFEQEGVTEALVETISVDGVVTSFRVKTVGVGEFQTIEVKDTSAAGLLSAFNWAGGYIYAGTSSYSQDLLEVPAASFPDPRGNLSQVSIEASTVRAFLGLGSGVNLRELSKTQSFLRSGASGTSAELTGTVDLSTLTYGVAGDLDGKDLLVTIDGGEEQTITFGSGAAAPITEADVFQQINVALNGIYADGNTGLRLTSRTSGSASSIEITGGNSASIFGFTAPNDTASGVAGVKVVDDGNGDALSPLLEFPALDFSAAGGSAVCTGLVDLSTLVYPGGGLTGKTLVLSTNGRPPQTLVFGAVASATAIRDAVSTFWSGEITATLSSNKLVLTSDLDGEESSVKVMGGTALGILGLVPSVTGALNVTTIEPNFTALNTKKLRVVVDGVSVEHTFSGLLSGSTGNDLVAQINGDVDFAAVAVAELASGALRIRSLTGGEPGSIEIADATSDEAAILLGFNIGQAGTFYVFTGSGHPPLSGDDLYVDGTYLGRITQVSPGGNNERLRVDKQLTINAAYGESFYIVAKNLAQSSSGRPTPDLVVAEDGAATIKHNILRDTTGAVIKARSTVYISYTGVRKDVTAMGTSPGLLRLDDSNQLEALLAPINTDNPLALGFYFALLNAPGAQVSGLGVDEISADAPYGTVEAFVRAAEYLEAHEVYAIAPLTHDPTVAAVFDAHVKAMSAADAKGERICIFNLEAPTKKLDTLVASGLNGNSVGATGLQLDTGIVNLGALVLSQGINPVGTIPTSAGLFLDIASDDKRYSIASIAGGTVTIRKTFAAGENDDGFYSTTGLNISPLPTTLISEAFAVRVRGASLTLANGLPDKQSMAETYQAVAQTYLNRRFWSIMPDTARATIGGLEQEVEGFYLCAAIAGMVGQQPPQQSFTNFPMVGFTGVKGSNDFFSDKQLNVIAAGGNYIVVQDAPNGPLTSRMALTTDMTSIETRTDSITKVVDFTAKFLRVGLKNFIGRFNITQGFLDSLGHVIQGLLGFLVDIGVLIAGQMNNIVQDESAPDTVLVDLTLDVPYPCNYIRLTLVI